LADSPHFGSGWAPRSFKKLRPIAVTGLVEHRTRNDTQELHCDQHQGIYDITVRTLKCHRSFQKRIHTFTIFCI
jgi:hypothetical protein